MNPSHNPGANPYLGGNPYPGPSNGINLPTPGQHGYPNAPYAPQGSPPVFQPQAQTQTLQQNANFQQHSNFQQSPPLQQNPYQQQMSPPPQQNPHLQSMSPTPQNPQPQAIPSQQNFYPQQIPLSHQISPLPQQGPHPQSLSSPGPHPPQMPPQQMSPTQPATWCRFMVSTNSDSISSGFQFHPQLHSLGIKHDEWHQFTTEIVEGAKLSATEDAAAWSAGASVGAVSSAFLLVFGPPIGYYTGKAIHKKTVVKKAKERMLEGGNLRAVLNKWNQRDFKWRGFQVWLEFPTDYVQTTPGAPRYQAKAEKKEAQKFRLVVIPNSEIHEPYSAAPWSQMQPGLVEAPSVEPQRPVELQNTPAQNLPVQTEPFKGTHPPTVTQVPAASELDAQGHPHESQPMPAELSA